MNDLAKEQRIALRQRWRQQLQRTSDLLIDHWQAAMTATGGKPKRAARILKESVAADAHYQRETALLDDLATQLGLRQPSPNPKPQKKRKRRAKP